MSHTIASPLEHELLAELRDTVRGTILTPEDDGYDEASKIWNGAHDGYRPGVIVRCTGVADVLAAVAFARRSGLPVAVRGGGHSVAGFSTVDCGIVIDLGEMNEVHVDPAARRATVGGGAVWADVDHETQAHGLATTGGLISTTGVAGFTLGGGIGWLMRKHGLACDNLVGADVVTADGRLLHVSESENAELLWGLRGGGGNFGIVTRFEFTLHEVGPTVYAGPIFYPADADRDLLQLFREWSPGASEDITAVLNLTSAPPLPVIPEAWHGRKVAAFLATSAGPVDEGEAHVREFRAIAEPVADLQGPMPYHVIQTLIDPLWERGVHAYFKATNLARLDDGLIDRLVELHQAAPGPQCEIHVHQMGGAVAAVGDGATAFAERSMPYVLNAVTAWRDPEAGAAHIAWARSVIAAASGASTGRAYVNFLGDAGSARSAYGEETYSRLVALKTEYDPHNMFARNQNIEPYPSGNGSAGS
ncbi:MAG: FAD-binding oxidoreductase [Solirubrobacteraceae bacterium]